MKIALALFDAVDLLDIGGPYEVFLTASRLAERDGDPPPFDVRTVGSGTVEAYGGLRLTPSDTFEQLGSVDVLVVPGAIDIDRVRADADLVNRLRDAGRDAGTIASVCTGAFLLREMDLLPDTWTTHWEDIPGLEVLAGSRGDATVRWVDHGRIVTSGGLSSGIAMALHLVERFAGIDLARRTARQIDYEWDSAGTRAV